jgi:hypothetical protein
MRWRSRPRIANTVADQPRHRNRSSAAERDAACASSAAQVREERRLAGAVGVEADPVAARGGEAALIAAP